MKGQIEFFEIKMEPGGLLVLKKTAKGLGDGVQRPAPMEHVVKCPLQRQPANRDFDDSPLFQFVADGDAGQDRKAETSHQSHFHCRGAAELHGYVQKLIRGAAARFYQVTNGIQRARPVLPRDKFLLAQIG